MSTPSRKTILLATDQQQSVLNTLAANQPRPITYAPYGHRPRENGLLSLLGFNGELPDPLTGHYHLGKGYRQFNPVLMRFNSPDSWSPFGAGGLNAYSYCNGEPVLGSDPTGHFKFPNIWKGIKNIFGRMRGKSKLASKVTSNPIERLSFSSEAIKPKKYGAGELISHPDDAKGSADFKAWQSSQAKIKEQILNRNGLDRQDIQPHSSKHFFQNTPKKISQNTHNSLPSFDEYLKTSSNEQLDREFKEIRLAIEHASNPELITIGRGYEQEMLNRAIRKSS